MDNEEDFVIPTYKLTTIDNPYHPVNERDKWEQYDMEKGYYTDALVYKIAGYSTDATEGQQQRAENDAIEFILKHDLELKYKKVLIED
jgi:hypothetical protein